MRRLGIYAFYDEKGIVDDYKIYLLESLRFLFANLIIVINGSVLQEEIGKLKNISENIYIRENIGYDAGAHKDIMMGKYMPLNLDLWDEIVLFNDTFYGPLYTWIDIFQIMEHQDNDFWGLSRHPGGLGIPEHIQSYFLVVSKRMFCSLYWKMFWNEMEYPLSYMDAVKNFEFSFTSFFKEHGFCFSTWLDVNKKHIDKGINPFTEYMDDIVQNYRFPVIKYREVSLVKYQEVKSLFNYVEKYTDYDLGLILKHLKRLDSENRMRPFGVSQLEQFLKTHSRVFILGHGKYGKGLEQYFIARNWKFSGFLVSHPQNEREKGIYSTLIAKTDGVIVALGKDNTNNIRKSLEQVFEEKQLLFPRH